MKDFKKLPKMACGGGVKKYNEGSSVKVDREPVEMPSRFGSSKPRTMIVDGKNTLRNPPVEMPSRFGSSKPRTRNIDGENVPVNPTTPQTRGNLELLKKGGKVKRGNKK
jgi:hypothetical protein